MTRKEIPVYAVMRFIHILSALVYFGGLLPFAFLTPLALREASPAARLAGLRLLRQANLYFLMPGSGLAGLTGFGLAGIRHIAILHNAWLLASAILFLFSFIVSMAVLAPYGKRLVAAGEAAVRSGSDAEFQALAASTGPRVLRLLTGLAGLAIAVLMVLRPR